MVNLVNERKQVVFGLDSIVIQKFIAGIKGGRALDLTGFTSYDKDGKTIGHIAAGHIIIVKDGVYKPMPIKVDESYVVKAVETGASVKGLYTESGGVYTACDDDDVAVAGTTYYEKVVGTTYSYDSLPSNHSYAGVLVASIATDRPAASIMTIGQVNEAALPFAITAIKSAFVAACPHIEFIKDEASV